jgi:hypothetical protein
VGLSTSGQLSGTPATAGVPAIALFTIYLGQHDVRGVRTTLSKAQVEGTPPTMIRSFGGSVLESLRTDPEIDRLHVELFGW